MGKFFYWFFNHEHLDKLIFGKEVKIKSGRRNHEKYVIGVINELLLKSEDEINIKLHVIDEK